VPLGLCRPEGEMRETSLHGAARRWKLTWFLYTRDIELESGVRESLGSSVASWKLPLELEE